MIEYGETRVLLGHDSGLWSAEHDPESTAGPCTIRCGDDTLLGNCTFRIDDLEPASALVDRFRAHHRGGTAVVEAKGTFPFGEPVRFAQTWRYASNHVRVTFDLNWPPRTELRRHFSIGDLELPGKWVRFCVISPINRIMGGEKPVWQTIPADLPPGTMIGHWHRPPLAIVLERENGTRFEIGTGSDVWRWEKCLGYGPESGSYKLVVHQTGIRFTREPLMCCIPFSPNAQQYRFTWYMAWQSNSFPTPKEFPPARKIMIGDERKIALEKPTGEEDALLLDLANLPVTATARKSHSAADLIRGKTGSVPCWESNTANKLARSLIRQIAADNSPAYLRIKGLLPQACHVAGHVDRKDANGTPHWDINSILDLSVWTRRQLGDHLAMRLENRLVDTLPSLRGLELPNGFNPEEVIDPILCEDPEESSDLS